jgi:hypothetical protein
MADEEKIPTNGSYPTQTSGTSSEPTDSEANEARTPEARGQDAGPQIPHRPGTSSTNPGAAYREYDEESTRFP